MEKIRFEGTQEQFIFYEASNKGFVQIPNCFDRCFFLSDGAKTIMRKIYSHSFGGYDTFPSHSLLRMETGWSEKTLRGYLNELKDKDLLDWKREWNTATNNFSNFYVICGIDQSIYVRLSESLWKIVHKHRKKSPSKTEATLKIFRQRYSKSLFELKDRLEAFIETAFEYHFKNGDVDMDSRYVYKKASLDSPNLMPEVVEEKEKTQRRVTKEGEMTPSEVLKYFSTNYTVMCKGEYKETIPIAYKGIHRLRDNFKTEELKKAIDMYLKSTRKLAFKTLKCMASDINIKILKEAMTHGYDSLDKFLGEVSSGKISDQIAVTVLDTSKYKPRRG